MFDRQPLPGTLPIMHKVFRKRIRHDRDGVSIAADVDAVISINTGRDAGVSQTTARSSRVVVQGAAAPRAQPDPAPADSTEEKP